MPLPRRRGKLARGRTHEGYYGGGQARQYIRKKMNRTWPIAPTSPPPRPHLFYDIKIPFPSSPLFPWPMTPPPIQQAWQPHVALLVVSPQGRASLLACARSLLGRARQVTLSLTSLLACSHGKTPFPTSLILARTRQVTLSLISLLACSHGCTRQVTLSLTSLFACTPGQYGSLFP